MVLTAARPRFGVPGAVVWYPESLQLHGTSPTSIAQYLEPAAVPYGVLHERYGAVLEMQQRMLGVIPNCNPLLEIWPVSFRTYGILVPNFLNMPLPLFGVGVPARYLGFAMYTSSRAARCMYCSAHGCAFAMRRGMAPSKLAAAIDAESSDLFDDKELAIIRASRGLSSVPLSLRDDDIVAIQRSFSAAHVEWIMLVPIMMGYLNKCMDALGMELEQAVFDEVEHVIAPSGWEPGRHALKDNGQPTRPFAVDSLWQHAGLLRVLPWALAADLSWTKGVPSSWPQVGDFLEQRVGSRFPILERVSPGRVRKALATIIRDNLAPESSILGAARKHLAGLVCGAFLDNGELAALARALLDASTDGARLGLHEAGLEDIARLAREPLALEDAVALEQATRRLRANGLDDVATSVVLLTRGLSESPARVPPALLSSHGAQLQPAALVELITWVSVCHLLHRLITWYRRVDALAAP